MMKRARYKVHMNATIQGWLTELAHVSHCNTGLVFGKFAEAAHLCAHNNMGMTHELHENSAHTQI